MKFENIKVGMKIQHKETGEVYTVKFVEGLRWPVLDNEFIDCDGYYDISVKGDNPKYNRQGRYNDAKLFRKYKEQK